MIEYCRRVCFEGEFYAGTLYKLAKEYWTIQKRAAKQPHSYNAKLTGTGR